MAETIVLDPSAVAVNRTQLDITTWVDADPGVDWGDAAITAYMADQQVGSSTIDYRLPNRQIKIPLNLRSVPGTTYSTIRLNLQQKVGLFQAEGGQIMRQIDSTPLYADIVNATLHLGGSLLAAYRNLDIDAVLSLETLPDWYGAEITLDSATVTGVLTGKLKLSSVDAAIAGNYPGRTRIVVTDTSGNNQKGLLWGFRSRHYDGAATAALFLEAEAMTPLNGAAGTALSGASGGTAVQLSSPPITTWVPTLSTTLASTFPLTHAGTYRVWLRAHSPNSPFQFRLQWGSPGLSVPVTNDAAILPATGVFAMLDLGQIRIDAPPVGSNAWEGVIQTNTSLATGTANIDAVYFQPVDETAGKLSYVNVPPGSSLASTLYPGTGADDASAGTIAWSNPGGVTSAIGQAVANLTTGADSHYLKATNFGFAIPTGATLNGIQVTVHTYGNPTTTGVAQVKSVRLYKAGTIQATDRGDNYTFAAAWVAPQYGSPTDTWALGLTATDINNSGFGVAVQMHAGSSAISVLVDWIQISIYYTLAGGFTIAQDAVVYGSLPTEIRTDTIVRKLPTTGLYGPVSGVIGDLPRIPPSHLEARPVELFVKPSRGDLATLADSGLDSFTAQVIYRPSFLFVGA